MRAWPLSIAAVALLASPALAQKTKSGAAPQSVVALEVCERFASGDVLAMEEANQQGWDAYETEGESPYVRSISGARTLPGIGEATLFVLLEDYPEVSFGYCRVDVIAPTGSNGMVQIQAIQNLDRYEGTAQTVADGTFASLRGTGEGPERLLLAHWSQSDFVIQLSIITPKPAVEAE